MLRRTHDHHRKVRTRRDPAPPTEPAKGNDQDRHLMIPVTANQRPLRHLFLPLACRRRTQARIASVLSHPPASQLACSAYIAVAPRGLPTLVLEQTDRTPRHALA